MKTLTNKILTIGIESFGAELASIKNNRNGNEYLWHAGAEFWNRHSPVLFPIVGSVRGGEYRHEGVTYKLGQHGFARDMEFTLLSESDSEVFFQLVSNETTLKKYPFPFLLEIGYRLTDNVVEVMWRVENIGGETMYFQIGAHPAIVYPAFDASQHLRGYLQFEGKGDELLFGRIDNSGCAIIGDDHKLPLQNGLLEVNEDTFKKGVYIFENSQINKVSLLDVRKKPYATMSFDAPVLGLWAPQKDNAPFLCIEPWYGRCDRVAFDGELKDRDWMNSLATGASFEASYKIEIGI